MALVLLFWTGYGLFELVSSFVYYTESGIPFSWSGKFAARMPVHLLWTLFVPFIYRFAVVRRVERPHRLRHLVHLALFGVPVAVLHRLTAVIAAEWVSGGAVPWTELFTAGRYIIAAYMFDSYIVYAAVVAVIFTFDYYRRYNERHAAAASLEARLAAAELRMLRAQIQPHFLFNTLHSISALVHERPDEADRMITLLSDLLRRSLEQTGRAAVTLRDEIETVRLYLDIQAVRFGRRLAVTYEIPPALLDRPIPALVLQPLAENCVKHALEKSRKSCRITVRAEEEGTDLLLSVRDNGPGLPAGGPAAGTGLSNIAARLEQTYGRPGLLTAQNAPEGGTAVTLRIPPERKGTVQ